MAMEIILREDVENLGGRGDVVKVASGYARNFLIPQRKARRATESAIADFATRRAELEKLALQNSEIIAAIGGQAIAKTIVRAPKLVNIVI